MPTTTTNFGLLKPGQEEFYNVDVPNANMDTIDGVLKALQDAISSGVSEQDLKELREALATHLVEEASLTEAGHVMLSNLISGSSETKAATELAVKKVADIAAEKQRGRIGIPVGGDINTLTETGVYTGYDFINGAVKTISAFDVFNYSNDWIVQVQYVMGATPQIFTRNWHNATAWTPWRILLDGSMINVPGGVAGLDGNGKLLASLTEPVLLHSHNLGASPTLAINFNGLELYKEIKILFKGVKVTASGTITVHLNNVPTSGSNYWYWPASSSASYPMGSAGQAGSINVNNADSANAQMNGSILVFNDTIYDAYVETVIKPQHPVWQYRPQGAFQLGGLALEPQFIHTVNLTSQNAMNGGVLEVWGLKR
ncbi:Phage tail fibre repeat-containing protein [Paenisporosarcina quisquiliarum]|nr:Phage tail fibre repeat-containing protein [Paenisporosarcina quisquiliarum]